MNIKDYWIKELIFPKKIIISKPGIIINQLSRKYGGIKSRQRSVFYFEDTFANLQLETIKKIGKEKSSKLWYKIGKDIGTRYMLLAKTKKPPVFLASLVINYIFMGFRTGGQSFSKKIDFNLQKEKLILEGNQNIICRKTKNSGFTEGTVSAIMSFILGKNIEIRNNCNCPNKCKIFWDKNCKTVYIPDMKKLTPHKTYDRLNFPPYIINAKNECSFKDMIKFRKIEYKNDKLTLKDNVLAPGEIGMIGIIYKYYRDNNLEKTFDKSIIDTSEKICKNMTSQRDNSKQKLNKILSLFCTLGYGIPAYKLSKEKLDISFKYAPFSKYGFAPQGKILNGFVNSILDKNFILKEIKFDKFNFQTTFYYI